MFIQELSIYGEFVQVRKTLFNYFAQEKWNTIDQDCFAILGKKKPYMSVGGEEIFLERVIKPRLGWWR